VYIADTDELKKFVSVRDRHDRYKRKEFLSVGGIYGLVPAVAKSSLQPKLRPSVISAVNSIILMNDCTTLSSSFLAYAVTLIRRPFI
jgi:hypothetical protein